MKGHKTVKALTKKEIRERLKSKIETDDKWAIRAMLVIYEHQTASEQNSGYTQAWNGVGFSHAHAEILSSFVKQFNKKGWLSKKQMSLTHRYMKRYSNQLFKLKEKEITDYFNSNP